MASYKNGNWLVHSEDAAFDAQHSPGATTPFSGIYRCLGCHREVVSEEGEPLPPQNHHQHEPSQGAIRWRLAVYAAHKPK